MKITYCISCLSKLVLFCAVILAWKHASAKDIVIKTSTEFHPLPNSSSPHFVWVVNNADQGQAEDLNKTFKFKRDPTKLYEPYVISMNNINPNIYKVRNVKVRVPYYESGPVEVFLIAVGTEPGSKMEILWLWNNKVQGAELSKKFVFNYYARAYVQAGWAIARSKEVPEIDVNHCRAIYNYLQAVYELGQRWDIVMEDSLINDSVDFLKNIKGSHRCPKVVRNGVEDIVKQVSSLEGAWFLKIYKATLERRREDYSDGCSMFVRFQNHLSEMTDDDSMPIHEKKLTARVGNAVAQCVQESFREGKFKPSAYDSSWDRGAMLCKQTYYLSDQRKFAEDWADLSNSLHSHLETLRMLKEHLVDNGRLLVTKEGGETRCREPAHELGMLPQ